MTDHKQLTASENKNVLSCCLKVDGKSGVLRPHAAAPLGEGDEGWGPESLGAILNSMQ